MRHGIMRLGFASLNLLGVAGCVGGAAQSQLERLGVDRGVGPNGESPSAGAAGEIGTTSDAIGAASCPLAVTPGECSCGLAIYPFDAAQDDGAVARDVSGNGFDLTKHGVELVPGITGEGYAFDGTAWLESVDTDPRLDLGGDYTTMAWAFFDSIEHAGVLIKKSHGIDPATDAYDLFIDGNGKVGCSTQNDDDRDGTLVSDFTVTPGCWTHLACRMSGDTLSILVNGNIVAPPESISRRRRPTYDEPLSIGRTAAVDPYTNGLDYFLGMMDSVRICAESLSDGEIRCCAGLDQQPPTCTPPAPLVLECNAPGGVSGDDAAVQDWLARASASDDGCGIAAFTHDGPAFFPSGCGSGTSTTVTFTATDGAGNATQCASTVAVRDTTPPRVDVRLERDACCLWPPNHEFVEAARYTLADICDPAPAVSAVRVTSDEHPSLELGAGGPSHCPDAEWDAGVVRLRAERAGPAGRDNGRLYGSVAVVAVDSCANQQIGEAPTGECTGCPGVACVPHDQHPRSPGQTAGSDPDGECIAVDDGQDFDASDRSCPR